jgi:hypothetical protein
MVKKRWNIFARELEDILADHGLRLGQLDDRAFIHREKVRRLRKSLERSKSFPVLNPTEMDEVIDSIQLDNYEVLRLRSAIIAASIQEMLFERIDAENAYIAVEQIFPTIMMAMENHKDEIRGLSTMRNDTPLSHEETEGERALEPALLAIDRATKALHLGRDGETRSERLERLQQAATGFGTAQMLLSMLDDQIKISEEWQFWSTEAQNGLVVVNQNLKELG